MDETAKLSEEREESVKELRRALVRIEGKGRDYAFFSKMLDAIEETSEATLAATMETILKIKGMSENNEIISSVRQIIKLEHQGSFYFS